jgi:hypothetical protein
METYLSAIVSYHLKPHTRIWEPGEPETTIVITAPKKTDEVHLKDISQEEATHRLSFLADIVDTEGYAIKGGVKEEVYAEANTAKDIFEMAQTSTLNQALQSNAASHHEELVNQMREAIERNNSFSGANGQAINHHFNNSQAQPLNQPAPYPNTSAYNPMPTMTPMPTATPMPTMAPQPTMQPTMSQAPLSTYSDSNLDTDPYRNSSTIIQPDLPIPETSAPPTYNEQIAETSEYLPEDEKERLEADDLSEYHSEEEQSMTEEDQQDVDYYDNTESQMN